VFPSQANGHTQADCSGLSKEKTKKKPKKGAGRLPPEKGHLRSRLNTEPEKTKFCQAQGG
jgi:hypothetical protein